jgi:mannose-6-phosphate isomerase-like protein (cupin superfamily)
MKRVVTGVDDEGRSYVVSSDELTKDEYGAVNLWNYRPEDIAQWVAAIPEEGAATAFEPPPGGSWWVAATFPPNAEPMGTEAPGVDEEGWHTTRTIDFDYVLSGELTLLLDRETVKLQAGDAVVQQATRHAWRNEGTEPAVLLVLLHSPA